MQEITLIRPDDWHLHVRDGEALHTVVPHTAAQFGRAIIMPTLRPPVTTAQQAMAYKARIQAAVPEGVAFEPLMTLYLTDNLPADEIRRAKDAGVVARLVPVVEGEGLARLQLHRRVGKLADTQLRPLQVGENTDRPAAFGFARRGVLQRPRRTTTATHQRGPGRVTTVLQAEITLNPQGKP